MFCLRGTALTALRRGRNLVCCGTFQRQDLLSPIEIITFHIACWHLIKSEVGTWASSLLNDSPKHWNIKVFPRTLILPPPQLGSWAWNCPTHMWQQISQAPTGKQVLIHKLTSGCKAPHCIEHGHLQNSRKQPSGKSNSFVRPGFYFLCSWQMRKNQKSQSALLNHSWKMFLIFSK